MKTTLLAIGLSVATSGCCLLGDSFLEIEGRVALGSTTASLPVKRHETRGAIFGHNAITCGQVETDPNQAETITHVDVPLEFCGNALPWGEGIEASFVFDVRGTKETFSGTCTAYTEMKSEGNRAVFDRSNVYYLVSLRNQ
jgi:hypothetical protein